MAELDIGKHCHFSECKRLDFLPFTCSWCEQIFCKEHCQPDHHSCTKVQECSGEYDGPRGFSCCVPDCQQRELTAVICEDCNKQFCLSHRHASDHNCEKLEVPQPKMVKTAQHVQEILSKRPTDESKKCGAKGRKSKALGNKVMLMKLKSKAKGAASIPESERVYLDVLQPLVCKNKSVAVFISKKWSVGRVVDEVAKLADLKNENNVAAAKKLRFFDAEEGQIIGTELSVEESILESGSTVIVEYIADDQTVIADTNLYTKR